MRKTMVLILAALGLFLASCSNNSSSSGGVSAASACITSAVVGGWVGNSNGDSLVFNDDCSGSSSFCSSTFNYSANALVGGSHTVTTGATNGASGCPPAGSTTCTYQVAGDRSTMIYNCGSGSQIYKKQN